MLKSNRNKANYSINNDWLDVDKLQKIALHNLHLELSAETAAQINKCRHYLDQNGKR
jgi:hypothetical protein